MKYEEEHAWYPSTHPGDLWNWSTFWKYHNHNAFQLVDSILLSISLHWLCMPTHVDIAIPSKRVLLWTMPGAYIIQVIYCMPYSIPQEICTRFCCALLCCGYAIVHNEFTWSIYPYSSGLLFWHWGNRYGKISQCITTTKHSKAKTVCIFLGIYCTFSWYSVVSCLMCFHLKVINTPSHILVACGMGAKTTAICHAMTDTHPR